MKKKGKKEDTKWKKMLTTNKCLIIHFCDLFDYNNKKFMISRVWA